MPSGGPALDLVIEQGKRDSSVAQHRVVEPAQMESRPERVLRPLTQAHDLALAGHVGERLAGPGDVTVDFVAHVDARGRGAGVHEVDRLLTRPSQVVNAGVHDEPTGTERREGQHPEPRDSTAVQADLVGEALGIQAPALVEGAQLGVDVAPVPRDVERLGGRELQVVPRHRFVERERLVLVAVALARIGRQQAVRAGAAAIDGRGPVVRHRGVVRIDRVDLLDDAGGNVVVLEVGVTCRLSAVEGVPGDRDDFLAGVEAQRRVVAHPRGDGGEVALTEYFLPDLRPQSGQLVDFRPRFRYRS